MPGGSHFTVAKLSAAVANKTLKQFEVDQMATRVLTAMFGAGIMDSEQPTGLPSANVSSEQHAALAHELATGAAVLLKNRNQALPLSRQASVAVIGAAADCDQPVPQFGFGWPSSIGCVSSGGGSGSVAPGNVTSILTAITAQARSTHYSSGRNTSQAAEIAAASDVAVVVVAVTSCEGTDRASVSLPPDQLAYLHAVATAQSNTVVLVMTPGALHTFSPIRRKIIVAFKLNARAPEHCCLCRCSRHGLVKCRCWNYLCFSAGSSSGTSPGLPSVRYRESVRPLACHNA